MFLPQVTDLLYHQFLTDVINTRNGARVEDFSIQKRKTFLSGYVTDLGSLKTLDIDF